ncbi:hypothetical protein [Sinomicrobium sp. M5D2P9]
MNRFFEHIGILLMKIDRAINRFTRKIKHFFKTYLYLIFFVSLFILFTFLLIYFFSDDSYGSFWRFSFAVIYILFTAISGTAVYFYIKKRRVKYIDGSWKVVDYKENPEEVPERSNIKLKDHLFAPVSTVSLKLKLRPQGYHGKEGIGQKDLVNYLNDYYYHQYENEIRYFVYMHFETEKKHQRLRKIKGPFEAPPIDDKTNFIELFWVLCKEEIITNSFSDVSTFLNTIYPWLGNSIEKIPSENKFSENYKSTPNIRTFLDRIRRKR